MHKEFADWYRTATVALTTDLLEARWLGVESLSQKPTKEQLIELLRIYTQDPGETYSTPDFIDAAFRTSDPGFPAKGNTEELRVLAGAVLRIVIEGDKSAAAPAAYGIVCGVFGGRLNFVPTPDHVRHAEEYLVTRAISVRDTKSPSTATGSIIAKERLEQLLPADAFPQPANLREPLFATLHEISTKERQVLNQSVSTLLQMVRAQREELNLLWWLQNAYSRDLDMPMSDLPPAGASVVVGHELAKLTVFSPGPSSIFGMIVTALPQAEGGSKVSLKDAINATPRAWRERQVAEDAGQACPALCAVQLAIATSLETDGDDEWLPVFNKKSNLKSTEAFFTRDLAYQAYRERMLVRALTEFK